MTRLLLVFLLAFTALCTHSLCAQDCVLTMSGRAIPCEIIDDFGFEVRFEVTKKNGKKKELRLHKSEIFSVIKNGGAEEVYYAQDDILGDWMSEAEMRIFLAGEQDARNGYDDKPTVYVGMALGAGGAYLAQGGLITTLIVPIAYTLVQMAPVIRIREETITDIRHQYDEIYALGYERVARPKKIVGALKGSATGMVVGVVLFLIFPQE